MRIKGIAVSPGQALGKVVFIKTEEIAGTEQLIADDEISDQVQHFRNSVTSLSNQYNCSAEELFSSGKKEQAEMMELHHEILNDYTFIDRICSLIESGYGAVYSVRLALDEQLNNFAKIENPYFRERSNDLKDVTTRLMYKLSELDYSEVKEIDYAAVLFAEELMPSVAINLDRRYIKGVVTNSGSSTSHSAILVRSMGIPTVMGCEDFSAVQEGELVFIDGQAGFVEYGLSEQQIKDFTTDIIKQNKLEQLELSWAEQPTITRDNNKISLFANLINPKLLPAVIKAGAEGIGLFRTEMLYLDRVSPPGEDEQYLIYKTILEKMPNKPVIIRTVDIGGDKPCACLPVAKELNPFMGVRGIRLSLLEEELFKTQLRAILRASIHGNAMLMFPMVSTVEEILQAKELLARVKAELHSRQINFNQKIPVGIMIEVPSAAIMADILLEYIDFVSIGSNDLIQYTYAADRHNPQTSSLCSHFNPAALRLIKLTIDYCAQAGKLCGLCGEMAAEPEAIPLLLGLGLQEFSVNAALLLRTRKIISQIDYSQAAAMAEIAVKLPSAEQVAKLLQEFSSTVRQ